MTTEITARDKLLLYIVGMLAFIFFFVQFLLTPAHEASDAAAADLAAQYPSVQLKSVQIDHAAYTNASGATTNTATYTVQLNVILCDKESVVS